ncbi:DNA polymerase III subunit gamma/tau [Clostridiales bacterium COT073_COT-073]|nr:DNA polymerase III subunit gamma/tau [Clostridiales bacterium COT073_COT-073]
MAYTALYRKLRPQNFEEVVGQDAIVKTLKNQIKSGRLSHAYLFTGTRGTGKTSTAKILARAANCLEPTEGNPCNQCENCQRDLAGNDLNIIEIDAASNNGVDNIRELREDVRYQPANAKYKVYIIDEVHMLSTGAFNALLKTLEEPPAHVIFILATTDPHKIPDTILSRCQRYDFRRITGLVIQEVLKNYLQKEGIGYEDKALRFIAKTADGALRDAHSILDRCLAFYLGEELTLDKVLRLLGAVDNSIYEELTADLLKKDISGLLHKTDEMLMQGRDLQQMIMGEIAFLRDLLIVKTMPGAEQLLDISEETLIAFRAIAGLAEEHFLIYVIRELSRLEAEMKYESNKRILLELAWIKLCSPELDKRPDNILRRLDELEKKMAERPVRMIERVGGQTDAKIEPAPKKDLPPIDMTAFPEDVKAVIAAWRTIDFQVNPFLDIVLKNASPFYVEKANALAVVTDNEAGAEYLKSGEWQLRVSEFLASHFQKNFNLQFLSATEFEEMHKHSLDQVKTAIEHLRQNINFEIEVR